MSQELIETVCKKCHYYRRGCFFDYGDSLTKIPCEALKQLALIQLARERARAEMAERNIDKKVFTYLSSKVATGAKEFNTREAAAELKLTPKQVFDSYKRLQDRGLIREITKHLKEEE